MTNHKQLCVTVFHACLRQVVIGMLKALQASATSNKLLDWTAPQTTALRSGSLPSGLPASLATSVPAASVASSRAQVPLPLMQLPTTLPPSSGTLPTSTPFSPGPANAAQLLQLLLANAPKPNMFADLYV